MKKTYTVDCTFNKSFEHYTIRCFSTLKEALSYVSNQYHYILNYPIVVFYVNDISCYESVTVVSRISIGDNDDENRYIVKDEKTTLKNSQKIELNNSFYDFKNYPTYYIESGIIPIT